NGECDLSARRIGGVTAADVRGEVDARRRHFAAAIGVDQDHEAIEPGTDLDPDRGRQPPAARVLAHHVDVLEPLQVPAGLHQPDVGIGRVLYGAGTTGIGDLVDKRGDRQRRAGDDGGIVVQRPEIVAAVDKVEAGDV